MQENAKQEVLDLTPEERQRLVCAFVWLVTEDKKQNPELYKFHGEKNHD
jgi:hypothetical protein